MTSGKDAKLEAFLEHLTESRGFDIGAYKRGTLSRRIQKRMQAVRLKDYAAYTDYLEEHPGEFEHLFDTILINVTGFFRDPRAWDYLAREVIPRIAAEKGPDESIRVWDAGCASGEEAYTLAMVLAEALELEQVRGRVKIYASDVDEEALTKGRHGVYTSKEVAGVPPKLLDKYFDQVDGKYVFRKPLRRVVVFGRHDLLQDAPISRVDLLACRNTLMYFNVEAQARILRRFHFALAEHGMLFLGKPEMLLAHADTFVPVDLKHRLFAKTPSLDLRVQPPRAAHHQAAADDAVQPALRDAAFHYGPVASLVWDLQDHLLLANEAARTLFGLTGADLGRRAADLGLLADLPELPGWIEQVRSELRPVFLKKDVAWRSAAVDAAVLDVRIVPLFAPGGGLLGVKAAFIDVGRYQRLQAELERSRAVQVAGDAALQESSEELQSAVEELETTNEELQSATEELETTNEELQSSNEELETMNEELQSTNDELAAVNERLRVGTDELGQAKSFFESVLTSLRVAVVVLDHDLHVTVWNPKAEDLWGLRPEEVLGKNFMNLDINLPTDQLRKPIRACLAKDSETAPFDVTVQAVNRRGKAITCRVTCFPLMNAEPGVILLMEDTPAGHG